MFRLSFCLWLALFLWKECNCYQCSDNNPLWEYSKTQHFFNCPCEKNGANMTLEWQDPSGHTIGPPRPGSAKNVYVESMGDYLIISIPSMTKSISGVYKCVITDSDGQQKVENLDVYAIDPVTIAADARQYIIKGQTSLIKCKVIVDTADDFDLSWSKNDVSLSSDDKYNITQDGLYVNDVQDADAGTYECTATESQNGDVISQAIVVEIVTVPVISDLITTPDRRTTLIEGERLVMACIADGKPFPQYYWKKDNEKTVQPHWNMEMNAMSIESISLEDKGRYECIAYNDFGNTSRYVDIKVLSPPNITSFNSIVATEFETVQLACNATGKPTPTVTIVFIGKDEDEMREPEFSDIKENFSFINASRADEGFYICNASNEVNSTIDQMYLSVYHAPTIEKNMNLVWGWRGQSFNLSCPYSCNPPGKVSWRFQGNDIPTSDVKTLLDAANENGETDYLTLNLSGDSQIPFGLYACSVTNQLGTDSHVITFAEGHIPPTVTNINITSINPTSATFIIDEPAEYQGPPIAAYIAEYDPSEDYTVTSIHSNRTWSVYRPYILEHLKPNTSYSVRFAPLNAVGYGSWSQYYDFQTEPPSPPGLPAWEKDLYSQEEIVNVTDLNQVISWKTPEGNGAEIEYFALRYCPVDEEAPCKEQKINMNEELKLDLGSLDTNATYYVQLVAHNCVGDSTPLNITIAMQVERSDSQPLLSAGALIGISIAVVFICLVLLDLLLLTWRRQGIIANCCLRRRQKEAGDNLQPRDKKGLLKDSRDDSGRRLDNRHKEYEYNKTTGVITGKHSSV